MTKHLIGRVRSGRDVLGDRKDSKAVSREELMRPLSLISAAEG